VACTFDTLISVRSRRPTEPLAKTGSIYRLSRAGAGFSSNDGRGSNPLPARSDGLDNVDGGPDAGFYIEIGIV
jgi:hypothetical protein